MNRESLAGDDNCAHFASKHIPPGAGEPNLETKAEERAASESHKTKNRFSLAYRLLSARIYLVDNSVAERIRRIVYYPPNRTLISYKEILERSERRLAETARGRVYIHVIRRLIARCPY